jgi:maleylacetate reductase
MEHFVWEQAPARVVFGPGTSARIPDEAERLGARRVFVIATRSAAGTARGIVAALGPRHVGFLEGVAAHVPAEDVEALLRSVEHRNADLLVAIGGGSAIGLAKAVAAQHEVAIVAVPTTYSGSEMTRLYGVTAKGRKHVHSDARVLPAVVLYDPPLTYGLPPRVTAGSGMNALAHAIEALWAPDSNPVTSGWAAEALSALARGLASVALRSEDAAGRSDALYGAFLAGLALAGTTMGLHHRTCHVLGGSFGIPHGDANAALLPHVVAFNGAAAPDAAAAAGVALATDDPATGLFELAVRLGAPLDLGRAGLKGSDLPRAAAMVVDGAPPNPRPYSAVEITDLLRRTLAGEPPQPASG